MAKSICEEALRRLLISEGGYSNHPSDPGGPTNFGITIHDYRRYVKPNATAADVRAMKVDEAKAIYREKYWDAMRCDELPAGVDYAVFDYGVNSGIGRAGKVLRRELGLADATSAVTPEVIAAAQAVEPARLVTAICDERLRFLKSLRTWPVFGRGWGRRVAEVRAAALAMAEKKTAPAARPSSSGKGVVPVNKGAQRGSAGGVIAGGAAAAQQAHQAGLRPATVVAIVIVTIAAAAGLWLFWRWRQTRQQHAPVPA